MKLRYNSVESLDACSATILDAFYSANVDLFRIEYFHAGEVVVDNGEYALTYADVTYASVPLSLIVEGDISVIENGKATKRLVAGDFFGQFETAYSLAFGSDDRTGYWTLVANSSLRIKILKDAFWLTTSKTLKDAVFKLAIVNHVPKPLSRLPVLDRFASRHSVPPCSQSMLMFHSHLLESSYDLIKHLASIFGCQNTFVLEKPYSTIPEVFRNIAQMGVNVDLVRVDEQMPYEFSIKRHAQYFWQRAALYARQRGLQRILVLSDGGDLLVSVPWTELHGIEVVAVEQTQRGINRITNLESALPPVVSVATCKAKKLHEASFIGDAIFRKMQSCGMLGKDDVFGLIGCGAIGQQIVRCLHQAGERVLVYDINGHVLPEGTSTACSLEDLLREASVVLGTSGTDCLRGIDIQRITGHKTFVSASSSNVEFGYLFNLLYRYANRFEDVSGSLTDRFSVTIANGGYPINFDREREWEAPGDIQLTRTLLYAGVLQALTLGSKNNGKVIPLDPMVESEIIDLWTDCQHSGHESAEYESRSELV